MQYSVFTVSYLLYLPYGRYLYRMEQNVTAISAATNHTILHKIAEKNTNRNALARSAGIPPTTFNRKVDGHAPWDIKELGQIADALGMKLPAVLLEASAAE
jgi:hypothetical protein